MLARSSKPRDREFVFTTADFKRVCRLLYDYAGISLNENKTDLVYGRLARRLRVLGMQAFSEYLDYLGTVDGHNERVQFINALTTNLTAFFREPHHFEFLADRVVPEMMQRHTADKRVRIWSAGCSTGEEAYSIAMVVAETALRNRPWDFKLLATDLDSDVVEHARRGRYTLQRIGGLSAMQSRKWFRSIPGDAAAQVDAALQRYITFKQLNLVQEWPMRGPFDVIFCRNVVIYFDKRTQQHLLERYADFLEDGGYLFLGHSETTHNLSNRFELVAQTIYRKRG